MSADTSPRLAVLGLGLLGAEIALRLKSQGFTVTGWNRTAAKAEALAEQGIEPAASAAAAVAAADLTLLLLSDAAAIEASLLDADPVPELAGKCVVQMGTIGPEESRRLAARVAERGGDYLEAPVLGSLPEARSGNLLLMAGGDPALFHRCEPVFHALCEQPRHIGELGQAAALKLAMNQLISGLTATFSLSLGLVRHEGVDVELFMSLLRGSALYAATFDKKLDKYLSHDYSSPNFPLKHLRKDIALFRSVAGPAGIDTAPAQALENACERGMAAGLAEADYAAIYEALTKV
ncbi:MULTISPECIES: NAD(P)-dependent oxidoreductase [Thiorhodovibrio]|uniref:NAD(P)-dependent oxidoreductase n=1 Tax=Thiorhodovibrio TaxID=61593 RepID=UPI00191294E9|nr:MULTISPECIES: NAD(P)-dependent oxidoreductase [Thiorhodovibrio]MBK5968291.1 hydroxyacid dehydrogenase [Thiorhodovibrio winogradskyi]WPL13003.1 2-hydroxy-3-oxopropionate reductase [Thiorhodovibrio litoralis]